VSSSHRVFSQRRWSAWALARRLLTCLLTSRVPTGPVWLVGDDTVAERPGPHVFGKGRHRDGMRSPPSYTASRWGHTWVVVSVRVKFPFAIRPVGRAIKRRRISPGSSWRAWGAGFQRAPSSLWGRRAMGPARPHGVATDTGVSSRW